MTQTVGAQGRLTCSRKAIRLEQARMDRCVPRPTVGFRVRCTSTGAGVS